MLDMSKWELHVWERTGHPIEKETAVDVVVHIRDNATGTVRQYRDYLLTDPEDDGTPSAFMYEEGNYACDCNRYLFFQRAANEDEDENRGCGDTAYSVNIENPKTGEVFYREFD